MQVSTLREVQKNFWSFTLVCPNQLMAEIEDGGVG